MGAQVAFNGASYVSFPDGSASFLVGALPTGENQKITITKNGFKTKTIYLENLNPYTQTVVRLEPQNSLANILPAISTGSDTINGPMISFLGKEFSLFSFEGKIDLPFNSSLSVSNDYEDKTIRLVGGISDGFSVNPDPNDTYWSESYREVKSFVQRCGKTVDTTKLWNQYSSLRGKLKKMGTGVGLDCKGSIALYAEFDYSSGQMVLREGGLVLIAEATLSQSIPFAPLPIFYLKFELGGKFAGQLSWILSGSGNLGPSGEFELQVKPKIGVGAGVDKIVLNAGVDHLIYISTSADTGTMGTDFTVSLEAGPVTATATDNWTIAAGDTVTGAEVVSGLSTTDGSGETITLGNTNITAIVAGTVGTIIDNTACIVQGTYDASTGVFTVGAGLNTGADSMLVWDNDSTVTIDYNVVILTGVNATVEGYLTAAAGVLTM